MIGLLVPLLLLLGNRSFGVSSNLRGVCAATAPCGLDYFRYDWKREEGWNLAFAVGILAGGFVGGLGSVAPLVPLEIFRWSSLLTAKGALILVGGGFAVGFGTAWAGGCTSGHAITGLADRQLPSLVAVLGFFAGGLFGAWVLLPWLL
jgi:hypothetical protein